MRQRVRSYRDPEVWQQAKALAVEIYRVTASFPKQDQYGLADQRRRAAASTPSNIAEGHIRHSPACLPPSPKSAAPTTNS
ncbi:MAG: four helix bundle protein [Anaerolineae bacterium]|nr:four helix bundle protein [Anaerolineae bacterium]MCX8068484.1 four helix bundle protein [Anaerolineae bacterium]MDW7992800.1 four helix bundle protein [Anaerolineae bacterium]